MVFKPRQHVCQVCKTEFASVKAQRADNATHFIGMYLSGHASLMGVHLRAFELAVSSTM